MSKILYLISTPLHAFFALGLMHGAFRGQSHALVFIDRHRDQRDVLAEALQACPPDGAETACFEPVRSRSQGRGVLEALAAYVRRIAPTIIAVGNDRRLEFYAAARACPDARRVYIDDGLYSYLPHRDSQACWQEVVSNWRRGLKYGLRLERPSLVGGSRAVQEAYVLLPQEVHAGLTDKPVEALQPEWFQTPAVHAICVEAAALAGFDARRCAGIHVLILLPHPRLLQADATLLEKIRDVVSAARRAGQMVAVKSHPGGAGTPAAEQLRVAPADLVDVPALMPVEVLVPLLVPNTLVAGTLTTALLSLALLGMHLRVRSLVPGVGSEDNARMLAIYASVDIKPLEDKDLNENEP